MKTGLKMRESKTRAIISGIKKDWQLYVILLPIVIWFLLFAYKPMAGLIVAFKRYDATLGIAGSEFKGLSNFNNIVAGINKEAFWGAFRNTFIISAYGLVFGFPIPIILALLFSEIRSEGYRKITQTITYLPHFLSEVTITGMTMADRIVIMNNGYIMQVGTPTELYDKPDNLFVAGFIGTPNMNFIKCIVDGTSLHIKDEIIPIAVSHQEILKPYDGKEVILGIRPEHIDMSEEIYNLHKAALTLPIDYYEYLGKEYYVKLRLYDDIITARLDSRYDVSKEKITVYFDMDRVCYFDPQTEQRIGRLKEDGKENI